MFDNAVSALEKEEPWRSILAQGTALVLTAIIPVLLLYEGGEIDMKIVGAAFSALAAIATGLLAINGWRENFVRYVYKYHMLQVEKYLYLAQASEDYPDDNAEKAARNFARRIEELVTLDVTEWRTEMQRIRGKSQ